MKMAIFGLARSGLAALSFLSQRSDIECFAVNSGTPESWQNYELITKLIPAQNCFAEEDAEELFARMDTIVKSPGIPFGHPSLSLAREKKVEIVSEIELAFRYSKTPVIAVTGTNGKTTTATMISGLLERLGKRVFLGGNIGTPYSEILRDDQQWDWAVIEVSSFQLENIKLFHPKLAVLTNIFPSHGERYDSHEFYRSAKLKIFQNMQEQDLALLPAELSDLNLACRKREIEALTGFDFARSRLRGRHNLMNLHCAYQCALEVCKDEKVARQAMQEFIDEFAGVPYRIQLVEETPTARVYNDGKSTNMGSTLAALDSLEEDEVYLILGGKLRDLEMDFSLLAQNNKVAKVYAFGEAKDFIGEKLKNIFPVTKLDGLREVFEKVREDRPRGALLFSPAFPSFDQYKDYEERALEFNSLARLWALNG